MSVKLLTENRKEIDTKQPFADLIAYERSSRDLSRKDFADLLKISASSLYSYEKGSQLPLTQRMEYILQSLNVPNIREFMETCQTKSLSLDEDLLLLDLIDQGYGPNEASTIFQHNGFDRGEASLGYHMRKSKEILGLSTARNNVESALVSKALAHAPSIKSTKPSKFDYGNLYQEFVTLVTNLVVAPGHNIPEYALSVIKDENGHVVHTTDIVDLIAHDTALEIKLGKYSKEAIVDQVNRQKRAIINLQGDEVERPHLDAVTGLDLIVLEDAPQTNALKDHYAEDEFVTVRTLEEYILDRGLYQFIEKPNLQSGGLAHLTVNTNYEDRSMHNIYKMFEAIQGKQFSRKQLKLFEQFLRNVNGYLMHQDKDVDHDKRYELRKGISHVFEAVMNGREINYELIDESQLPRQTLIPSENRLACHYEEDGELKTIQRQFGNNLSVTDNQMKKLMKLWNNLGFREPFTLSVENLQTLVSKQQEVRKDIETPFVFESPDISHLEEITTGHRFDMANYALSLWPSMKELIYGTHDTSLKNKIRLYKKSREEVAKSMDASNKALGTFKGERKHLNPLFSKVNGIHSLGRSYSAIKSVYRALAQLNQEGLTPEVQEVLVNARNKIGKAQSLYSKQIADPDFVEHLELRLRGAKVKPKKYTKEEKQRLARAYLKESLAPAQLITDILSTGIDRTLTLAEIDPEIATLYSHQTLRRNDDGEHPYARFSTSIHDDPLFDSLQQVYTQLSKDNRWDAFLRVTDNPREAIWHLSQLPLQTNATNGVFYKSLDQGHLNKAEAWLHLSDNDIAQAKRVGSALLKSQDAELETLELGQPIYEQLQNLKRIKGAAV